METSGCSQTTVWQNVEPKGKMLRPSKVVELTGLSRSQVYSMIADGQFPPFLKLSQRASAMPESWLEAFLLHRVEQTFGSDK